MHHIMFDIDGTLVESYELDSECFVCAVEEVTGIVVDGNWSKYRNVTDAGILAEIIENHRLPDTSELKCKIKESFVSKIRDGLKLSPVSEVRGASMFLNQLRNIRNITVSIATGGWYESAILKLEAAGINIENIPIATSNDHYDRKRIMTLSQNRAGGKDGVPCTYFGDAIWDQNACAELGVNFVLIGNKLEHNPSFQDFRSFREIIASIDPNLAQSIDNYPCLNH